MEFNIIGIFFVILFCFLRKEVFAMTGLNRLTGTPWHVEKFTRGEDDDRRHRSKCIFYRKENAYCVKHSDRCYGAGHCDYYKEDTSQPVQTRKPVKNRKASFSKWFIALESIRVNANYEKPAEAAIERMVTYYKIHGDLGKPLVVSRHGSKYLLEGEYLRYCAAKRLGLETVPVVMK